MPHSSPEFLAPLLARPVAIFGGGVSGAGTLELLNSIGAQATVFDRNGAQFDDSAAKAHWLVVFSPGFAPGHPWLVKARAAGCECLGELDFASLFWRGPVIAVTGTNGKTTLTEFLRHALVSVGRQAVAVGNVGYSFASAAARHRADSSEITAVCEVSSFQAETLRHFRADALIWTNFAEDHLERHGTMEAYFSAKAVLLQRSQRVFAGSSVKAFAQEFAARQGNLAQRSAGAFFGRDRKPLTQAAWVESAGLPADPGLAGTPFAEYPQRENFALAAAWWSAAELSPSALYAAAGTFRLDRHRLAWVGEVEGVTYWNDSKATNFHAVEAALPRFARPVLLIAGGKGKGGDLDAFVGRIAPRVRRIFLIGETAQALARACANRGLEHSVHASLADAFHAAAEAAAPGEHVLLSPGFASFDMFKGYADRGDQFEHLVNEIRTTATHPA